MKPAKEARNRWKEIFIQTKCLLFRIFLIKFRMKCATVQEIFWPLYFVFLLSFARPYDYSKNNFDGEKNFTSYSMLQENQSTLDGSLLMYYPNKVPYANVMKIFQSLLVANDVSIIGYLNKSMLEKEYEKNRNAVDKWTLRDRNRVIGIEFSSLTNYTLRFSSSSTPSDEEYDYWPGNCRDDQSYCPSTKYRTSGFAELQIILDAAIAKSLDSKYQVPDVEVAKMPISPYKAGQSYIFQFLSAFYLTLSMSFFSIFILAYVVFEKEKKLFEAMKMMGMKSSSYWLAWFLASTLTIFVITLTISILLKLFNIFIKSSFLLIFLLLFLQGCSIEMFSYMLTPFFTKAASAAFLGGFISFASSSLFLIVVLTSNISSTVVWLLSLFSPAAFSMAIYQVSLLEEVSDGANFQNISEGDFPIRIAFIMIPIDILIYGFLTLYFDKIIPSEYGVHEKPWFLFTPSYWWPRKVKTAKQDVLYKESEVVEAVSDEIKKNDAIKFINLSKTYKPGIFTKSVKTEAVKKFSLNVYAGQITALLGHNGAGKTTIFNMLTGFCSPTRGTIEVCGYDLSASGSISTIREMIGVCPQYNLQFDVFTVKENILLFAGIKLLSHSEAISQMNRLVKIVGLEDQLNTVASKLSGGQKRKLSVVISLLGDPKIVVLDEPTAGMDPTSRRRLWKLLRDEMKHRIILLSTHFMDEADILADRKAIISKGRLTCVGSSLFLKNKFGIGYHLKVTTESTDHENITSCVQSHVDVAEIRHQTDREVEYTLPMSHVHLFANLFADIESKREQLQIKNFVVSMTTLEEVFLKIGEEELNAEDREDEKKKKEKFFEDTFETASKHSLIFGEHFRQNSSNNHLKYQVYINMVYKQLMLKLRTPGYILFGLLFGLAMAVGGIFIFANSSSSVYMMSPPRLRLNDRYISSRVCIVNETGSSLHHLIDLVENVILVPNITSTFWFSSSNCFMTISLQHLNETKMVYQIYHSHNYVHAIPKLINMMSSVSYNINNFTSPSIYRQHWPENEVTNEINGAVFGGVILICLALVIGACNCIQHPVQEREVIESDTLFDSNQLRDLYTQKKIRKQLRISGVSFRNYWMSLFTVDLMLYYCIAFFIIIGLFIYPAPAFSNFAANICMIIIILGYGPSLILSTYLLSFFYNRYDSAQSTGVLLVEIISSGPFTLVSLLDMVGQKSLSTTFGLFFSTINPMYNGFGGLYGLVTIYESYQMKGLSNEIPLISYFNFSYPTVPYSIICVFLHPFLLYYLVKITEVKKSGGSIHAAFPWLRKLNPEKTRVSSSSHLCDLHVNECFEETDVDVRDEAKQVGELIQSSDDSEINKPVVLVHKLWKKFDADNAMSCGNCFERRKTKNKKVVVRDLSFSVQKGQVLGLLGPNGAGKTTAINIITAEENPDSGNVYVTGYHVKSNISKVYENMGYCPQDNPIWDELTFYEHLYLYALSSGIPKSKIKEIIKCYLDALGVNEHAHKYGKNLSSGTQRKLCFIIAMLNNPPVVLLDEPTSGQDPKTKRFLWDTICKAFEGSNRGAILTTHYMDEADALCSKVGIMVKGRLKCIGSTQHLKNKFGQGYVLEIKLKENDGKNLDLDLHEFISKLFIDVSPPEEFGSRFVYNIPFKSINSLAEVFGNLENSKEELQIEQYSFSQSTLEQVFLEFAKEQSVDDNATPAKVTVL